MHFDQYNHGIIGHTTKVSMYTDAFLVAEVEQAIEGGKEK